LNTITIWEAARATSAASTFFEPIKVGADGEEFIDGATGANNPIDQVVAEARDIWTPKTSLEPKLHCIVSIGTGVPEVNAFGTTLRQVGETLKTMATETEKTAEKFRRDNPQLHEQCRYFRFNVLRGLEKVGLEEAGKRAIIVAATRRYIALEGTREDMETCATTLRERECMLEEDFS